MLPIWRADRKGAGLGKAVLGRKRTGGVGEQCELLGVGRWSSNRREDVINPISSDEETEARHWLPAEKPKYERMLASQSFRKDMKDRASSPWVPA